MDSDRMSYILTLSGVTFVAIAIVHFFSADFSTLSQLHIVSNLLINGGTGIGLIYVGYWHSQRSFRPELNLRVLLWALGGATVLTVESIITQPLIQETLMRSELVHLLQINIGTGLLFGSIVGSYEARALTNAAASARAETRVKALENERERWSELNTMLRHYILNSVTSINYRIEQLRSNTPDDAQPHLDTIDDRMQTIATIGTHVDRLGPSPEGDEFLTVTDLQAVFDGARVRAEIDVPVTVETGIVEEVVRVGKNIEQDLALLFEALATVMDEEGTITCTCRSMTDEMRCQVTATPAELPPAVEAAIFEPIERKTGLKLYLVGISMNTYADLKLVQNCEKTVTFAIVFEKAPDSKP